MNFEKYRLTEFYADDYSEDNLIQRRNPTDFQIMQNVELQGYDITNYVSNFA